MRRENVISSQVLERLATETLKLTGERPEDVEFREMMIDKNCVFERPVVIVGVYLREMSKARIYVGHTTFVEVDGQGYIPFARPQFAKDMQMIECACGEKCQWRLHVIGCVHKARLLTEYLVK